MRFLPLLAGLAGASFLIAAASPEPAPQESAPAAKAADENPLHDSMMEMQSSMKALRKLMRDPAKKDDALAAVRAMEDAVLVGMANVPKPKKDLNASDLLKHDVDFKKRMIEVYGNLLDLELALDEGDADKIKNIYRALGGNKKEGHGIYIDGNGK